jgi:hypothetical protein
MKVKLSKKQWQEAGEKAGWIKTSQVLQEEKNYEESENRVKTYQYYINLDERGSFYADIRDENGNSVFDIKAGNVLDSYETSVFQDGFMKDKNDLQGLKNYLVLMGIMKKEDSLIKGN